MSPDAISFASVMRKPKVPSGGPMMKRPIMVLLADSSHFSQAGMSCMVPERLVVAFRIVEGIGQALVGVMAQVQTDRNGGTDTRARSAGRPAVR